jgi:hypothetical protein
MQIRILDSAMIVDFINEGFDSTEICAAIKSETETLTQSIKNEKIKDWEVCFRFIYNNVKQILIYTKNKSYTKERYKDITTHIPIPIKDNVSWGVGLEQHVYRNENHLDHLLKNFNYLDVDYSKFSNRKDYILDCMRRTVKFCFNEGFTINSVKVKL